MKKKQKHIPVRLSGLVDGRHELEYTVAPEEIDLPEEFGEPVSVHVNLDKTHSQIALHVQVETAATYPCDRCLDPVRIPVMTDFVLVYAHDNSGSGDEESGIREIPVHDPTVDIAEDVRDAAMLCIPMRHICGEDAEGNPLCRKPIPDELRAEKQAREDPRWDALRKLKLDK